MYLQPIQYLMQNDPLRPAGINQQHISNQYSTRERRRFIPISSTSISASSSMSPTPLVISYNAPIRARLREGVATVLHASESWLYRPPSGVGEGING